MKKLLINFTMLFLMVLNLSGCADSTTSPFSEGEDNTAYYFGWSKAYKSYVSDPESKRLSANIQRKIAVSDVEALRGGGTLLLVGNVATKVDIETARSIALVEYTDDRIVNKLLVESIRSSDQLSADNDIAEKVESAIHKQKLELVKSVAFRFNFYLLYPKDTDKTKMDLLVTNIKKMAKGKVKAVEQIEY